MRPASYKTPSIDLIKDGDKFHKLEVIKCIGSPKPGCHTMFECKCDCGNTVTVRGSSLLTSHAKSCGCQKIESARIKRVPRGRSSLKSCFTVYKGSAKIRHLDFSLSIEQFQEITSQKCFYCGAEPSNSHIRTRGNGSYVYNGIDRVDNKQGYINGNVVPCCKCCNYMKQSMGVDEFINHIKRIYKHLKLVDINQGDMLNNIKEI